MKKDLQNGRSMIEMLGVLSIIGILTVGGFSLVSKAVTENRINNVVDEISALAQHTRVVFREFVFQCKQKSTSNPKSCASNTDMTEYLCKARAYPDVLDCGEGDACGDCSDVKNFIDNEEIKMSVNFINNEGVEYYVMKIESIPGDICMAIANGKWGTAATNGFSGISFDSETGAIGGKVDLADAAGKCPDDANSTATIYLAFR